jgi:hypothetical protein
VRAVIINQIFTKNQCKNNDSFLIAFSVYFAHEIIIFFYNFVIRNV